MDSRWNRLHFCQMLFGYRNTKTSALSRCVRCSLDLNDARKRAEHQWLSAYGSSNFRLSHFLPTAQWMIFCNHAWYLRPHFKLIAQFNANPILQFECGTCLDMLNLESASRYWSFLSEWEWLSEWAILHSGSMQVLQWADTAEQQMCAGWLLQQ